jgi:CRISPR system Cascade subunit CasE
MYLTSFRLNTARSGARRLLASPHMLHAAVMSSFASPPSTPQGDARVLWRVDHNSRAETLLYIASPDRPDLTHLQEQAGWPTTGTWQTRDYGAFLSRLSDGEVWAFRLTANPVHKVRTHDEQTDTKRTAHRTPRHQIAWLAKQQQRSGFALIRRPTQQPLAPETDDYEVIVHRHQNLSFTKSPQQTSGKPVTLNTVTYDGRLRITDADAVRQVLTAGLGKAKAYGCGLMTLAPVR